MTVRPGTGFAIAAGAVLAGYNNVLGRYGWHRRWYPAVNAVAAGCALAVARGNGLTAADLGLKPGGVGAGLRLAAGPAAAVAAGWLMVTALPATRPVLRDRRVDAGDGGAVAYHALVRIPAGTVLWEEVAFRGVLQAALRRVLPPRCAIAVTCAVFGLWHVRPTIDALRVNGLVTNRRRAAVAVTASVTASAAGGAVLSRLRERSGSLAAPMLVHLSTNSPGPLLAWAVSRRSADTVRRAGRGRTACPRQGPGRPVHRQPFATIT